MKKLADRVFIITGATRGMGAGIARTFAREGARLVLSGRDHGRGEKLKQELESSGAEALFIPGDVTLPDYNRSLAEKAVKAYGTLNGVVTNAGMLGLGAATELDTEEWQKTLDTNLSSVFYLLKYAIPEIVRNGGGAVVINASIAAFKTFPNHPAYCASKAGVVALARQVAADYGPALRINSICPGPVDTPLIHESASAFPDPARAVSGAAESSLMKRLGNPDDIASLALFLVSDEASWITGSNFTIDGGVLANS